MRDMRQLAALDSGTPHDPTASAVAQLTCLAATALFCIAEKTSCRPKPPMEALVQARLHHAHVRMSAY